MAHVMFEILDGFSVVCDLIPAFKVHVFTSDFKFWILLKWILVVEEIVTLLTFIALLNLQTVSIFGGWCLFDVNHYVNFQLICWRAITITIWWSKFELECPLLIFIYFATNIYLLQYQLQSPLKKRRLWMLVYQNPFRRKKSKFSKIKFAILNLFTSKCFN